MACSDYWINADGKCRIIHIKEAQALFNTRCTVQDDRVDTYVDNLACVFGWENMSGTCTDPVLVRSQRIYGILP